MKDEKYKAGTKWGEGISSQRTDGDLIHSQKESIGLLVQERMKKKGLSFRKLENMTNVNLPQIHNIIHGRGNYGIETLLRVLNALEIRILDKL